MQQSYQDAMAFVRKYGKPDLFVTFTCNPTWPEIVTNLLPGQTPSDRPDLVSSVFYLKMKSLIADLMTGRIFGEPVGFVSVVEFQKRGLPHMHLLLTLAQTAKPHSSGDIDQFVMAELPPNDVANAELRRLVLKHMVHGPCGELNDSSPCMVTKQIDGHEERVCSKKFPRKFQPETVFDEDRGVCYRRRNDGRNWERVRTFDIDNRWVVPYNRYLMLKYGAHINVEICESHGGSVKYLYKYIFKGYDRASVEFSVAAGHAASDLGQPVRHHDEIK